MWILFHCWCCLRRSTTAASYLVPSFHLGCCYNFATSVGTIPIMCYHAIVDDYRWRIQMLCVEASWLSLSVNLIGILLEPRPLISLLWLGRLHSRAWRYMHLVWVHALSLLRSHCCDLKSSRPLLWPRRLREECETTRGVENSFLWVLQAQWLKTAVKIHAFLKLREAWRHCEDLVHGGKILTL